MTDDVYRVELEQFSGPMDLLLHLLREEELDALTIPVARICDRFLRYLDDIDRIDIDAAGDFLVMASTLMRMKSRALLPSEDQILEDDELDPRFELVRQLIQYRRFKRVAELLDERRESASRRFARGMHPERDERAGAETPEVILDGAGVELLFAAFAKLMRETRMGRQYVVTVDDTPIDEHIARVEALVPPGTHLGFRSLIPTGASKAFLIGVFLALLELLKRGRIAVQQEGEFGKIEVRGTEERAAEQRVEETRASIDAARAAAAAAAEPPEPPGDAG